MRSRRFPGFAASSLLTPVAAVSVLATFVALGVLATFVNRSLLWGDEPLSNAIRGIDGPTFRALMSFSNELGSRWVIGMLMLPVLAVTWFRCRQLAVVIAGAFVATVGIELMLKALVDRPRPPGGTGFGESFPSGHVLAAMAFWGLIPLVVYVVTRRRWVQVAADCLVVAGLVGVGMSRIHAGAHWPSDVLGGYLAGAIFVLVAEWSVRQRWPALGCDACDLHPRAREDTVVASRGERREAAVGYPARNDQE